MLKSLFSLLIKSYAILYSIGPIKIRTLSLYLRPIKIIHFHLWNVLLNSISIYINSFTTYLTISMKSYVRIKWFELLSKTNNIILI